MYYNYNSIKFDTPLLGVSIQSGYRVRFTQQTKSFISSNHVFISSNHVIDTNFTDNFLTELHDYLCQNYGESNLISQSKTGAIYLGTDWYLSTFRNNFTLVLSTEQMFLDVMQHFNLKKSYTDVTIKSMVEKELKKYLSREISDKLLRKIQSNIASQLTNLGYSRQWYDINVKDGNKFSFLLDEKEYIFQRQVL